MTILAEGLACAASPVGESVAGARPVAPERPIAPAPAPPRAPLAPEPPAGPEDEQAGLLAEVRAMDPAARWAWAVSVMPQLGKHSEADPAPAAWASLRRRGAGRGALWVRTRGARCFAARGGWEDDRFLGRAHVAATITGDIRTVEFESVEIDASTITVSGPHGEEFTRDARGRWRVSGGFGLGSGATLADRPVSEFRGGAAYYGGQDYTLTVECAGWISYEERCTDGTTRRCERCGDLVTRIHATGMYAQGSGVGWQSSTTPRDCTQPCPPDVHTPLLPALNLALEGRRFHTAGMPVAAVYTSRQMCQEDRTPMDVVRP